MEEVRKLLMSLSQIPEVEWEKLRPHLFYREYKKGEHFARSGDLNPYVGLVRKGIFRKYYVNDSGAEFIKDFVKEGELFGNYSSLIQKIPTQMNIEALEDSEVLQLNYNILEGLYSSHACWEKLGRRLAEIHYIKRENREMQFLLMPAKERYQQFLQEYNGLENRISQYHVASYLGVTAVTLSRIRHDC